MKLKELSKVLSDDARRNAEVRMETKSKISGYDIVCQGAGSRIHGDKEIVTVYPIVFNGERRPSLIIWVKNASERAR